MGGRVTGDVYSIRAAGIRTSALRVCPHFLGLKPEQTVNKKPILETGVCAGHEERCREKNTCAADFQLKRGRGVSGQLCLFGTHPRALLLSPQNLPSKPREPGASSLLLQKERKGYNQLEVDGVGEERKSHSAQSLLAEAVCLKAK